MRLVFLLGLVALVGCYSPSPQFIGTPQADVTVSGMRFSVHRRGDAVEVYRLGFIFRPNEAEVLANPERAIEITAGCAVRGMSGDPGADQGDAGLRAKRLRSAAQGAAEARLAVVRADVARAEGAV